MKAISSVKYAKSGNLLYWTARPQSSLPAELTRGTIGFCVKLIESPVSGMKVFYLGNTRPDHPPGVHSALYSGSNYSTSVSIKVSPLGRFAPKNKIPQISVVVVIVEQSQSSSTPLSGSCNLHNLTSSPGPVVQVRRGRRNFDRREWPSSGQDSTIQSLAQLWFTKCWITRLAWSSCSWCYANRWSMTCSELNTLAVWELSFKIFLWVYSQKIIWSVTSFPGWIFPYPWSLSQLATPRLDWGTFRIRNWQME